jgi:metallo-beta-lactamase family protein
VIPAFAVDRTEVVLWHLDRLVASDRVPDLQVFVDSPMASRALAVYEAEAREGSAEVRPELRGRELFPDLRITEVPTAEESKLLNTRHGPFIVVSASGMATGGRVVHHLATRLGSNRNVVVLVGFQAPGTRGDALAHGARSLRMFGHDYPVRARVVTVPLSAHADRSELGDWVGTTSARPDAVYVNHGEPDASSALAEHLTEAGVRAIVPGHGQTVSIR